MDTNFIQTFSDGNHLCPCGHFRGVLFQLWVVVFHSHLFFILMNLTNILFLKDHNPSPKNLYKHSAPAHGHPRKALLQCRFALRAGAHNITFFSLSWSPCAASFYTARRGTAPKAEDPGCAGTPAVPCSTLPDSPGRCLWGDSHFLGGCG